MAILRRILIAGLVAIALLTGCGGGAAAPTTVPTGAPAETTPTTNGGEAYPSNGYPSNAYP